MFDETIPVAINFPLEKWRAILECLVQKSRIDLGTRELADQAETQIRSAIEAEERRQRMGGFPRYTKPPGFSESELTLDLHHFIRIAHRGKPNSGASSGEVCARRIAVAILGNAGGIDNSALNGAAEFMKRAPFAYPEASALIGWDGEAQS